jgi:hypothetical protein
VIRASLATAFALFAAAPAAAASAWLPAGEEILLETVSELSSKKQVKGDLVPLRVARAVRVEGAVLVPAGASATGQIVDARAKGALGMSGKLSIRPLFIRQGDVTIRLGGQAREKGTTDPGAIIGMAVLSAGFTGRSAVIPAGTRFAAIVERGAQLPVVE